MKKFGVMFAMAFLVACGTMEDTTNLEPLDMPIEVEVEDLTPGENSLDGFTVTNGYLKGIDHNEDFAVEATALRVREYPYISYVDVIAEIEGRAIMARFSTEGELSDFGTRVDIDSVLSNGIHCAGNIIDSWDTDRTAMETFLIRENLEDGFRIHFAMEFYNERDPLSGYFDFTLAE